MGRAKDFYLENEMFVDEPVEPRYEEDVYAGYMDSVIQSKDEWLYEANNLRSEDE